MRLKNYLIFSILIFLSAVFNSFILSATLGRYDEGIVLVGAMRILSGEVPHRDFWSIYPPGQTFVLAGLFKFFGSSLEVERYYDLCLRIVASCLVYVFLRNIAVSSLLGLIGWFTLTFWLSAFEFSGYPILPALVMLLMAANFLALYAKYRFMPYLFWGGVFIGLTTLFRFDFGVVGLISYFLTLYVFQRASHLGVGNALISAASGAGLVALFTFGPLVFFVGFEELITQLVLTPAAVMPKYRSLPIPEGFTALSAPFYLCPLILIFSLYLSLNRLRIRSWLAGDLAAMLRHAARKKTGAVLLFFSALGLFSLNQALVRSDMIHLLPLIFICSILSPIILSLLLAELRAQLNPKLSRAGLFTFLLVFLMTLGYPAALKIKQYQMKNSDLSAGGSVVISDELSKLVDFISRNTLETDGIYVGVVNHDRFTYNDVAVYFLAQRRIVTRYHELHPGVTTTPQVQNEMVRELTALSPKLIVLADRYVPTEQNLTSRDLGLDILDEYLRANFKKVKEFGPYQVFVPNSKS
jgi:hypothetical protein